MLPTWLPRFITRITRRHRRGTLLGDETLLDFQIRAYLRSEYANEIPPSGAFPRLMRAVQLHREEQQIRAEASIGQRVYRNIRRLGQALPRLYHRLGRSDTSRIISSGLVTALMLFALWPSMKQMLASNYFTPGLRSNISVDGSDSGDLTTLENATQKAITPSVPGLTRDLPSTLADEQRSIALEQRNSGGYSATPASEDPNYLDPVELRLPKKASPLEPSPDYERPLIGQE